MIYSASRRTDLVAFFPDWIVTKVRRSRKLEALVLWTKDPRPLATHTELALITERIPTVVQFTLTGLAGTAWEPHVPPMDSVGESLQTLAARLPRGAVRWRFDPIVPTADLLERFRRCLHFLREHTGPVDGATVSFLDLYAKVKRRLAREGMALPRPDAEGQRQILRELLSLADDPSFRLRLCCEPHLDSLPGTEPAHCIDGALIDRLYGTSFADLPRDAGQRAACGCSRSTDIGNYDQICRHDCLYCYARPARD